MTQNFGIFENNTWLYPQKIIQSFCWHEDLVTAGLCLDILSRIIHTAVYYNRGTSLAERQWLVSINNEWHACWKIAGLLQHAASCQRHLLQSTIAKASFMAQQVCLHLCSTDCSGSREAFKQPGISKSCRADHSRSMHRACHKSGCCQIFKSNQLQKLTKGCQEPQVLH